jgi:hypothetical protein
MIVNASFNHHKVIWMNHEASFEGNKRALN